LNNTESIRSCFNSVNSDNEDTAYENTKHKQKLKLKNFRRYSHHHHHQSVPHSYQPHSQFQRQAQDQIQNNNPNKLNKKTNESFRNRLKSQSDNLTTSNQQTTMYADSNDNASKQLYTDLKTTESSRNQLEDDSICSNDFDNNCNLKFSFIFII